MNRGESIFVQRVQPAELRGALVDEAFAAQREMAGLLGPLSIGP
jgi:hypothetical protein